MRRRLRLLSGLLAPSNYDIVCLQEVMYRSNLRFFDYPHVFASGAVLLKGGLAVLSRLPLRERRFHQFAFRPPRRPEWLMRKGFQVCTCDRLTVVNTHLSANRDDDWSSDNRYTAVAQAELAEISAVLARIDGPVVVTGDFNLPRQSTALSQFITSNGLTDAMAGDPRPTYRPSLWPDAPALDHVLFRGLTATADLMFQDVELSDHYGVAARLETP